MENNEITEQTLSKLKSEILSTIQVAMSRERAAQEKKMEELCNQLIASNKSSSDSLKQVLVQLRKPTSEEKVTTPVSSPTPASAASARGSTIISCSVFRGAGTATHRTERLSRP